MKEAVVLLFCLALAGVGCDQEGGGVDGLAGGPHYQGKPISKWVEALSDEDVYARRDAAKAFARMGQDGQEGVPALEGTLANPKEDNLVRYHAALSLWTITQDAASVVPQLILMLNGRDADARYRAVLALQAVGPAASAAVPHLNKVIEPLSQRDYSTLLDAEQLLLATVRDALSKIEGEGSEF
jgi:hypothetical protein